MTTPPVPLADQIAAMEEARGLHIRSMQWRAGRRGFDPIAAQRVLRGLDAAIATLRALAPDRQG